MHGLATLSLTIALSLALTTAMAQPAPAAKPAAAKPTTQKAPRPADSRKVLNSEAQSLALATETAETVSAAQLDIAARVLTGKADCEFNQTVDVDAVPEQPGVFKVKFKKASYVMVPEETTTGAVRLFDRRTGILWLQIPVKSMLLDAREGHRLVDLCTHAEQRAAVAASTGAAKDGGTAVPATPGK